MCIHHVSTIVLIAGSFYYRFLWLQSCWLAHLCSQHCVLTSITAITTVTTLCHHRIKHHVIVNVISVFMTLCIIIVIVSPSSSFSQFLQPSPRRADHPDCCCWHLWCFSLQCEGLSCNKLLVLVQSFTQTQSQHSSILNTDGALQRPDRPLWSSFYHVGVTIAHPICQCSVCNLCDTFAYLRFPFSWIALSTCW